MVKALKREGGREKEGEPFSCASRQQEWILHYMVREMLMGLCKRISEFKRELERRFSQLSACDAIMRT